MSFASRYRYRIPKVSIEIPRRQALTVRIGLMTASANSLSIASSTSCGK
jgi:hypothetical protein